ncbi:MAG TPA: hypothetical protein VHB98_18920 [Chloroflexota bacterium]|nr:hypothetical protein [Chloroflexota bacterium]
MYKQQRRRVAMGLAVVGIVCGASIGLAPSAHAQSIEAGVTASVTLAGSTDVVSVNGSGFTPGGTVTIYVYDSTTGALLQTVPVQASGGVAAITYVAEPEQVCTTVPDGPLNCQIELVSVPQTTTVVGGAIATSVSLPATTDTLVVEAVDAATSVLSNQVILTGTGTSVANTSLGTQQISSPIPASVLLSITLP